MPKAQAGIHVLFQGEQWEGEEVAGVFDNPKDAKLALADLKKNNRGTYGADGPWKFDKILRHWVAADAGHYMRIDAHPVEAYAAWAKRNKIKSPKPAKAKP